jgi:NADP-dependent 3-hydroxy acid dehydrogenase YdfG
MGAVTADYSIEDYKAVRDSSRNFTGKVILVTGSSSGIGEGIVKLTSILGAKVVGTGITEDKVKAVAKECEDLSPYKLKVRIN